MECDRAQDLLPGYLDGSLTLEERGDAERHIRQCSRCAAEERALNETLALLRGMRPEKAPPDLLEGVRRRIAEEAPPAPARGRFFRSARVRIPAEAAAAVVLVLLLYGIQRQFLHEDRPPAPSPSRVESASAGEGRGREARTQPERAAPNFAGKPAEPQPGRFASRELLTEDAPAVRIPGGADAAPEGVEDRAAQNFAGKPAEPQPGRFASRELLTEDAPAVRIPGGADGAPGELERRRVPSAAQSGLPVVPATRVSSGAEPIRPQFSGESRENITAPPRMLRASPGRLHPSPVSGREVRLEVLTGDLHGVEASIAMAAEGLGGTVRRNAERPAPPTGVVAEAAEPMAFMRLRIPAESEEEFLEELRKLGSIAEDGLPSARGGAEAGAPDAVVYTVWIRVR